MGGASEFRHHHLEELRIGAGKKDVGFARLVMERAVSLELLVLDARITCEGCIALGGETRPSSGYLRVPR
jgi:hypothetical protein